MLNYDLFFIAQGVIDGLFSQQMQKCYDDNSKTLLMPFCFFAFGLNLAVNSPTVHKHEGDLYSYPLYVPWWLQSFHVMGSFYYVYLLSWYMKSVSNHKFNETFYEIFVGGSMWAYLSHYLWIVIVARLVVKKFELEFIPAAPIIWLLTETLILLSQLFLNWVYGQLGKISQKIKPSEIS